jgi:hypothetical protein
MKKTIDQKNGILDYYLIKNESGYLEI